MDCSQLTVHKLYAISKNDELNASIRTAAAVELNVRNISSEEMEEIIQHYEASIGKPEPLNLLRETLLWLNPIQFPFLGWARLNSKLQIKGREKQRREFLLYLCGVILIITTVVVLWAKYGW